MSAGTGLGALGLLVIASAHTTPVYFAGWLVLGISGAGMLTTAMQIGMAELAGVKARQMIGVLLVLGGLGSTLSWPLLGILQASLGWRLATMAGAGILLIVPLPIYLFLLAARPKKREERQNKSEPIRLDGKKFALLAFATATNGVVTWGFSLTIITLLEARGLAHASAIGLASSIGLIAVIARLFDQLASSRWNSLVTGIIAAAVLPISFAVLVFGTGMSAAIAFVVLYGLASGALAIARATMPLDLFPPEAYARAASMLALPLNLSFACAPPLFAAIIAGPGSDAALWLATALSFCAFLAMCLLGSRQKMQKKKASPSDGALHF